MTDKEMIRKAEISKSHWHNLQTNKTKNSKDETIVKLCKALNITTDWLLTGKGRMYKESSPVADPAMVPFPEHSPRKVVKVLVFYDDNTFDEFQ